MSDPVLIRVSRAELAAVFESDKLVRAFERLLSGVVLLPDLAAVQQAITDHISDATDAHQASAIGATPIGSLLTNTVAGQLGELDAGKQPLDATLTALAGVSTAADRLIYAIGADTFDTTPFSAFARTLLDDADAAAMLGTLGAEASGAAAAAITAHTAALDPHPQYAFDTDLANYVPTTRTVNTKPLNANITLSAADVGADASGTAAAAVAAHVGLADPHTQYLKESDIDTDGALAANSDLKVASQKAAKTYADARFYSRRFLLMGA